MAESGSVVTRIKGLVLGHTYAIVWYLSILIGFYFLYIPLLPLLLINRRYYRKCTDILYVTWETYNVCILELILGVKLVLTGDSILPEETSLLVVNHPTRTDWNFLWCALHHAAPNHNAKIVLKQELRTVPGVGWAMAMSRFLFLARSWSSDCVRIDSMLDYYSSTAGEGGRQLILFPEGTNLTVSAQHKSDQFAMNTNKPRYRHVLHPRTTGFVHLARGMKERGILGSVLDCTIAYSDPETVPLTESHILQGCIPREVHVHIVRHPASTLPSTYVGMEKWLEERWREKEAMLEAFHCERTPFPASSPTQHTPRTQTILQPLCLVACSMFLYSLLCSLSSSVLPWIWILVVTLSILGMDRANFGLQELELYLQDRHCVPPSSSCSSSSSVEDFEHLKPE